MAYVECETKVIRVIMWASRTISKSFGKYLTNILGKHDVKQLQKTAILGTAYMHFGKY